MTRSLFCKPGNPFEPGMIFSLGLIATFVPGFFGEPALAAPVITHVTGTLNQNGTMAISGSGFGSKASAEPFLWDDFEAGLPAQSVAGNHGWVEYGNPSHVYTNTTSYSGSQSAWNHTRNITPDWFRAVGQKGLDSDRVYISFYAKWRKYSGTYSGNTVMKFFRINSQPDFYVSRPSMWFSIFPNGNDWFYANVVNPNDLDQQDLCGGGQPACTQATMPMDGGPWGRFELYFTLSTPGVADGMAVSWWNFRQEYTVVNGMTRDAGLAGQHLDNFLIPAMNDEQGGNVLFDYYVDDIYVDRTQQRVEISDSASWGGRTHSEVQIPSVWTDTQITVSANLVNFAPGATVYLYVLDANGGTNSPGFPLVVGSTQANPPNSPRRLRIFP